MTVSVVILAAGRNARLGEVVPPYYKPLMTVDGKPLITRAIDQVESMAHDITVVASPANVQALVHVINGRSVHISIQPEARGPGDALRIGLRTAESERSFVLMGDNTFRFTDLQKMLHAEAKAVVGIGLENQVQANRFTRVGSRAEGRYYIFEEGPDISENVIDPGSGMVTVWRGPLLLPTDDACCIFSTPEYVGEELKIGPRLSDFSVHPGDMALVEVQTEDIGIPEMLP